MEVQAVADELSQWAQVRGDRFFLRPDASPHWVRSAHGPTADIAKPSYIASRPSSASRNAGRMAPRRLPTCGLPVGLMPVSTLWDTPGS